MTVRPGASQRRIAVDGVRLSSDVTSCCSSEGAFAPGPACPANGRVGRRVPATTVQALVTPDVAPQLELSRLYFLCLDRDCDIVYYSDAGEVISSDRLTTPVGCKQPAGQRILCYCFGESEPSITAELRQTGRSGVEERIRSHIAAGECLCECRNPTGTCCLGDVRRAVRDLKATFDGDDTPLPSPHSAVPSVMRNPDLERHDQQDHGDQKHEQHRPDVDPLK